MFKIDKNVKMPPKGQKPSKYPFQQMEVGDSFFVPNPKDKKRSPITSATHSANKKLAPKRFTSRTVTESGVMGMRIWRTQ